MFWLATQFFPNREGRKITRDCVTSRFSLTHIQPESLDWVDWLGHWRYRSPDQLRLLFFRKLTALVLSDSQSTTPEHPLSCLCCSYVKRDGCPCILSLREEEWRERGMLAAVEKHSNVAKAWIMMDTLWFNSIVVKLVNRLGIRVTWCSDVSWKNIFDEP